ncbi:MAG TPA: ATP-binding protein [Lacunisphaera sp.]|nr:ATP-binding protein [Lacunisphaera sp.]
MITSGGEFWTVVEADRQSPHPLCAEVVVYFYDPAWKLLYGDFGGLPTYMPVQGQSLPIKAGQRVRFEGTVIPAQGFDGERITVTVLAEGQLPKPLPTAGRMADLATLNGRRVQLEGYVLGQNEADPTHVEIRLWSEGRLVLLTLMIGDTDPVPQLVGALIRVVGVYDVALNSAGGIQVIKLWTSERDKPEVLGWLRDDARFKLPRTPIDELAAAGGRPWVRVAGTVQPRDKPGVLIIRDESGQMEISTAQPEIPPPGVTVEVVGRRQRAELGWTLTEPLFRRLNLSGEPAGATGGANQPPVLLRLADQIVQLTLEEAAKRQPVTLRGVVTWWSERTSQFYLQDISGGVAIRRQPGIKLEFGATATITGTTVAGATLPEVEVLTLNQTGLQGLPPPRRITLEQAQTGAEEGRWVEMRGYVRQVSSGDGWTRLDLTAATGEFSAWLPATDTLDRLAGYAVRLHGVCVADGVAGRDAPEVRLWMQNSEAVEIEQVAPTDPFAGPRATIASIGQLSVAQMINRRAHLAGTVLLHVPGRYLYLQDATGGLFILSRDEARLNPGDRVEVAGIPGRLGGRPVLREAHWRPATAVPEIASLRIEDASQLQPQADARQVTLQATLRQAVTEGKGARLALQAGGVLFDATLHEAAGWRMPEMGSRVELTGVYVLEFDEYRRPRSFRLEVFRPSDIAVKEAPPWWTARRTLMVIALLAAGGFMAFAWVVVLRRRVNAQTEQLRLQLEKEARMQMELEQSTRLESLGVLAGGIAHDFNNLLTAILGNLGLASLDKRAMEAAGDCIVEAERGARRARDITQQLLTFAKGGDPVRAAVALPEIITEAANFARHGSNVRFKFDLPADLPPGDVDAGQISRVVHNLVINAVQAMPRGGVVSLALAAATLREGEVESLPAGNYLKFTVVDGGEGIAPELLPKIFDPYFSTKSASGNNGLGLATVHSIVKKHNGHIEVESKPGQGTTFRVWLPAAKHQTPASSAPVTRAPGHVPARILVMDDEDVIRRVAGRMLSLAGHEAVFAADGNEAVRAYVDARRSGRPFDLVIFDLTVPGGMGGRDALKELREFDPEIRAMASSGYSSDPVMANPRNYGFRTSLPKPYDIPDLMRAVEETRRS